MQDARSKFSGALTIDDQHSAIHNPLEEKTWQSANMPSVVDFGTESGRAVLVDVSNGGEIGEAKLVHPLVLGHEFAGVTEDCQRVAIDSAIPADPVN